MYVCMYIYIYMYTHIQIYTLSVQVQDLLSQLGELEDDREKLRKLFEDTSAERDALREEAIRC
jgi:hypothetical protein